MTPTEFRANLPEFADAARYPDSQITRWLALGGTLLSAEAWGDLRDYGLELYTAHQLTLWRRNADTAATGGAVGQGGGLVSSKAVDKVSVSYDTGATTIAGMGDLNLTTYGVQFARLSRQIGMGAPSMVSGGAVATYPGYAGIM